MIEPVDTLLRVGRAYSMTAPNRIHRAVGIRDRRIVATSAEPDGLDALRGARTAVVDDPSLVVLPAFNDTHNHQLLASRDLDHVGLEDARTIADVVELVRRRCLDTPAGEWVVTSRCWHESHLVEKRLPTAADLDAASTTHPIVVQRGGHLIVANTCALVLAGITAETPDPEHGTIARDASGRPTGLLVEPGAVELVRRLLPALTPARAIELLARQCAAYNAQGIAVVRDPGLYPDELQVYRQLREQGRLTTRSRVLIWITPDASLDDNLAFIDAMAERRDVGDELLRLWGVKLMMDGGVERADLRAPYAHDPSVRGHAFWRLEEFTRIVERATSRGLRVGCHAVGDNAVAKVLDAYEVVLRKHPDLPPGSLVMEHAMLADAEQRARAIRARIPVTVQHPLVYSLGGNLLRYWGPQRTRDAMPVGAWLHEGAEISAGSDCNVAFSDPMLSVWGLVTRGTRTVGVQGAEYAVSRFEAFRLYTAAGAALLGETSDLGTIEKGRLADLVAFRADPVECPLDDVPSLAPALTLLDGGSVHDPDALLAPQH